MANRYVIDLGDASAADASVAGSKAARLAEAARLGLPRAPGFVLTTAASGNDGPRLRLLPEAAAAARMAWQQLSEDGAVALVVRSSSTIEDATTSSMAGRFLSLLDVRGWQAFLDAVDRVLASASLPEQPEPMPMAVLVQPMLRPRVGGVLFGLDPVTGNPRHLVVEAVPGGPDRLVNGTLTAARYVLDRRGRLLETDDTSPQLLDARARRRLARLARNTGRAFHQPQDIEWAIDDDGRLFLLQSRPVTTLDSLGPTVGPVLGPGPVGETFPHPLRPLEIDLWIPPLRRGITIALRTAGAATRAQLESSPVVTTVGGRVAVDLQLLGVQQRRPSPLARLDPRGPARHLAVAWRVGRMRTTLPALIDQLVDQLDLDLGEVPGLTALTTPQLIGLLGRVRVALAAVHGYEILAGMLLGEQRRSGTAAGAALAQLARERAALRVGGVDTPDGAIVARHPEVLSLVPPRIGRRAPLPASEPGSEHVRTATIGRREALRLRARWLQEMGALAAAELGRRLVERGILEEPDQVALLTLPEVVLASNGGPVPVQPRVASEGAVSAPLPAAFRLTTDGRVVPQPVPPGEHEGHGAGGGRGVGRVRHLADVAHLQAGDVLVVRTLEPELAGLLPQLGGLVAETGSTLSHLAILARELQVPTVVALANALDRFPPGQAVVVDGVTGEVSLLEPQEVAS